MAPQVVQPTTDKNSARAPVIDKVYVWGDDLADALFLPEGMIDLDSNDAMDESIVLSFNEIDSEHTESPPNSDKLQQWIDSVESLYGEPGLGAVENSGLMPAETVNHKYPLHRAASTGNLEDLAWLIEDFDINSRDKLDSTPLHVAVINNQQAAIEFLVEHQADVNALAYEGYSPLALALKKQNFEAVDYLMAVNGLEIDMESQWLVFGLLIDTLENSQNPNLNEVKSFLSLIEEMAAKLDAAVLEDEYYDYLNWEPVVNTVPFSIALELQAAQTKNPVISDMILQSAKNIQAFDSSHDTFVQMKLLTHLFAVDGNFEIQYPNQYSMQDHTTLSVVAEGFFGIYTVQAAIKYIKCYTDKMGTELSAVQIECFEDLQKTLLQALNLSKATRNEDMISHLFEQFQQGEIILIPTGWEGHFIVNIIDGKNGYFISSNTGQAYENLDSGSIIYKMHNPEKITPEILEMIANNEEQFYLEYELNYILGLEELVVLSEPHQTVGNCGWRSIEIAVEAFTFLDLLDKGYPTYEAAELAHQWYQDWFDFTQENFLTEYLQNNENCDINLLSSVLLNGHPTLFDVDLPIAEHELSTAAIIVDVLAKPQYADGIADILDSLSAAKPELRELFSEHNLEISQIPETDSLAEHIQQQLAIFDSTQQLDSDVNLKDVLSQDNLFDESVTLTPSIGNMTTNDFISLMPIALQEQIEPPVLIEAI